MHDLSREYLAAERAGEAEDAPPPLLTDVSVGRANAEYAAQRRALIAERLAEGVR